MYMVLAEEEQDIIKAVVRSLRQEGQEAQAEARAIFSTEAQYIAQHLLLMLLIMDVAVVVHGMGVGQIVEQAIKAS